MSVTVKARLAPVGRWRPDSQGRLQEAALALFAERGFDQVTAAEIASRAGVTERTFFRHFADKREVLFGGSDLLVRQIVAAIASAPEDAGPIDAMQAGLDAAATMLGAFRRDLAAQRHAVIVANPELRERERGKRADYAAAAAAALRERGVRDRQALFAAEVGMTVLGVAVERWVSGTDDQDLRSLVVDSVAELRSVVAGG